MSTRSNHSVESVGAGDLEALIEELRHHQTELELQNEALREAQVHVGLSHERYRQLFELAPVSYLSLDQAGRVADANCTAALLLQRERTKIVGTPFTSYLVAEDAERFELHRRKVLTSQARCACELVIQTGLGTRREVRVESLRVGSAVAEWLMAIVDMTEVHRLERELQQARRLEAIGTLAAGMAHDFNNLLMGMLGCTDMALERLLPESDTHMLLSALRESVLQGRSVVSQLLAFARGSSGEAGHDLVELDAFLQAAARLLRQRLGSAIELRLDLDAAGARVRADASQLHQIVLHIASNSRHAMPDGGVFSVETRLIPGDDGESSGGPRVRLRASDTGQGMDDKTLARAFEPFFTTRRTGEGSGLGLSMVYGAVRHAGGRIELDSAPGKGTRVEIEWPLGVPLRQRDADSVEHAAAPPRALVVDDERLVRMALRHYMEKLGYQVIEAPSAEEGLELLAAQAADVQLLVSDVMLPGLKGPELAAQVRRRWPQVHTLLMSGHPPETLAQRGLIEPGTRVLRKPFTPAELRTALDRCLAMHAAAACASAFADAPTQPSEYTTH